MPSIYTVRAGEGKAVVAVVFVVVVAVAFVASAFAVNGGRTSVLVASCGDYWRGLRSVRWDASTANQAGESTEFPKHQMTNNTV